MPRRKQPIPDNHITYKRPTVPLFHYQTPNRPMIYTYPDGGQFYVRLREWTWRFGYIYYVVNTKYSLTTGRLERRAYTERELLLKMGNLALSARKAA